MKDIKWLINRLKSMNAPEVMWRIQQKLIQKKEYKLFFTACKPVTDIKVSKELDLLTADGERLGINWDNQEWTLFEDLDLFGVFVYQKYRTKWNAGFQTENEWPINDFSYNISVSQREDIGDIRTNWELNRHFQFVGLAKNYYVTRDKKYLDELSYLFDDWNNKNLFLHGIQWTSIMEVAIRVVSWSYTYAFVQKTNEPCGLLDKIANGIKVMADYILVHRARYSSANNHLIVEMLGLGIAGILFNYSKWVDYSVKVLSEELPKQNYSDGVNKEMSLHYQTFVMEAYGIMLLQLKHNKKDAPEIWFTYLEKMSEFVADCCGDFGETIVFGDNDEGKILGFSGKIDNYYQYVLQLMGIVLSRRFTDRDLIENIMWLATSNELDKYKDKVCYIPRSVSHYKQGGYTLLRSADRKILIGFDHAELGFGSLAAHGHCDALSIQLFNEGKPILVDSGTYNYHVPPKIRNEIRSTKAHNTLYLKGLEQAEMLGPFLWGRRYKKPVVSIKYDEKSILICEYLYIENKSFKRTVKYDFSRTMTVADEVVGNGRFEFSQIWNINDKLLAVSDERIQTPFFVIESNGKISCNNSVLFSPSYNKKSYIKQLSVTKTSGSIETKIQIV